MPIIFVTSSNTDMDELNSIMLGGGTVDALDDAEYEGSVISLIDNGEAFIKRNAKMQWRKIMMSLKII